MKLNAIAVAALVVFGGCKELSDVFAESDRVAREEGMKGPDPAEEAAKQAAQDERERQLSARATEAGRRTSSTVEPGPLDEKVAWLVERRVGCEDVACSEKHLARLRELPTVTSPLLAVIQTAEMEHRIEAVRLVGLLEVKELSVQVAGLLSEPSKPLRRVALTTLGWLADPQTLDPILKRLEDVRDAEERRWLIGALAGIDDPRARSMLRDAAQSSDVSLAIVATRSLGKQKGKASVDALEEVLALAESPAVKRTAIEALGDEGSPDALKVLRAWTKKGSAELRKLAKETLQRKQR